MSHHELMEICTYLTIWSVSFISGYLYALGERADESEKRKKRKRPGAP
jgi:hypothetical protein